MAPAFGTVKELSLAAGAIAAAVADLDGDSDLDVAVSYVDGPVVIYYNDGTGTLSAGLTVHPPSDGNWCSYGGIAAADFDADGGTDNDGVLDVDDDLPLDPTESLHTDADGIGNNADTDDDDDGVDDASDAFPLDPTESVDTDGDGIGNNTDTDDDGDGVSDADDYYPLDPGQSAAASSFGGGGCAPASGASPFTAMLIALGFVAARRRAVVGAGLGAR